MKFAFTPSDESIKAGKLSYERAQKRTVNRDAPVSGESAGAQLQAVLGWGQPNPNALNELKAVTNPVLIAHGQEDIPVPVANAKNMAQSLPNVHLIVFPDAGHAAVFQYPDSFVQQATEFLGQ